MALSIELYTMHLQRVVEEAPKINTYYFDRPEGYTWQEGEHIHLAFPDFRDGPKPNRARVRHMSIASLPTEEHIMITTRMNEESPFKQALLEMPAQYKMALFNPSCKLALRRQNKPLILLTMGVGIAAFRPLILAHHADPSSITYMKTICVAKPGEEVYKKELEQHANEHCQIDWLSNRQSFHETVKELPQDAVYYVVGSDAFIQDNLHNLLSHGVEADNIVLDLRDDLREFYIDRALQALV